MLTKVILSVGSNRSFDDVEKAVGWLRSRLIDARSSSLYMTPAIQGHGAPYVNAVVEALADVGHDDLDAEFKRYELENGRDQKSRSLGIVPVDIDIVVWDNQVVRKRDFDQSFFRIGFSELACSVVEG